MLDKSLNFLRPYEIKDLIRIGRNEDGGYIVPKEILNKSNFLLSFGMGSHWNFEEDFLKYSIKNIDKILPLKKINKFPINGLDFPNLSYVQDLEINFNK